MRNLRKTISIFGAVLLLITAVPAADAADSVYLQEIVEEQTLVRGVTYQQMCIRDRSLV